MTDGTRWMEEVAANVSRRVKKWQDWEKSPALKASEELIGRRGMMTAEQTTQLYALVDAKVEIMGEKERPFCEGCDHGVTDGGLCELCQGMGYKERRNPPHLGKRLQEAQAEAANHRWIAVGERLPDEDQRLIVWNEFVYDQEYAVFADGKFIDESGTETDISEAITHWQPIPAPPKEGA